MDIQSISITLAALSFIVAVTYYILVLRATERNRRIQIVSQLSRDLGTVEGMKYHFELLNMEWGDYDDFERKYGSDTNQEAASIRYSMWALYNSLGNMLRSGMVDGEDLWNTANVGIGAIYQWAKWNEIIDEQRLRYNGRGYLKDFEYLAGEMLKFMLREDPLFKVPETFARYIPDQAT
jgi:hypothetical protein